MNYNKKIDVVIPYHEKDGDIIKICVAGCKKNIPNLGNIYIISQVENIKLNGIKLINENKLFSEGLSGNYIKSKLAAEQPELISRSGWLFQQFIKMGCSYAIPKLSDFYLVLDSDVVFLKKVNFFDKGKMLLTRTNEYHKAYFNLYQKLLGESANRQNSFIAHHMLISKSVMFDLFDAIKNRFNKSWYDAILEAINIEKEMLLSEYETYGHYLKNHYPNKYTVRKLTNIQNFKLKHLIRMLTNQADYVTFHNYKKPENNPKTNPLIYKLILKLAKNKVL